MCCIGITKTLQKLARDFDNLPALQRALARDIGKRHVLWWAMHSEGKT
ncbi:hypothetical protein X738_31980 [Mesorhizobium sp. LNHC209A00]|nr:hypothetical protein X738_31980 [Mesorhizobium sp. LNHC209A00]